ncbi:S8 family peptidase [Blastococcus atacamensis]|uniref:S8 family peptidase n=1 Tax=Blastococcus atacamensis TaxID=2070508 RepID=UPI001E42AE66|nr:S8 family peptidase [Blastococcus atacamensis]
MHIRRNLTMAAIAALTVTSVSTGTAGAAPQTPALATYIVTVAPGAAPAAVAARAAHGFGGRVEHVYTAALNGFAIRVAPAAADRLSKVPGVVAVEPDQVVQARPVKQPAPVDSGVSWGLDRIDQRTGTDGLYTPEATGTDVTAYVIDTGIALDHPDFGGRAVTGFDAVDGGSADDCNGHGTHVAGTIGGTTYGVAKSVSLVAVRVLNCSGSGTNAGVIAGIDWVTAHHVAGTPAVANMSLGGGASTAIDTAVANSIGDGVSYAVAAGNGNQGGKPQDACNYSPARVPGALTVGATDRNDAPASFSNYGPCVDLFAPGVGITSDWYTGGTNTISGTSMATPHVAGVAAVYLQTVPTATPTEVSAELHRNASPHVVSTSRTANNDLVFTDY